MLVWFPHLQSIKKWVLNTLQNGCPYFLINTRWIRATSICFFLQKKHADRLPVPSRFTVCPHSYNVVKFAAQYFIWLTKYCFSNDFLSFFTHRGRGGRAGKSRGGWSPRTEGEIQCLISELRVFQATICLLLFCVLLICSPGICLTCLLIQGPQGLRGAMGMMGPKGERVNVSFIFKPTTPCM